MEYLAHEIAKQIPKDDIYTVNFSSHWIYMRIRTYKDVDGIILWLMMHYANVIAGFILDDKTTKSLLREGISEFKNKSDSFIYPKLKELVINKNEIVFDLVKKFIVNPNASLSRCIYITKHGKGDYIDIDNNIDK